MTKKKYKWQRLAKKNLVKQCVCDTSEATDLNSLQSDVLAFAAVRGSLLFDQIQWLIFKGRALVRKVICSIKIGLSAFVIVVQSIVGNPNP